MRLKNTEIKKLRLPQPSKNGKGCIGKSGSSRTKNHLSHKSNGFGEAMLGVSNSCLKKKMKMNTNNQDSLWNRPK